MASLHLTLTSDQVIELDGGDREHALRAVSGHAATQLGIDQELLLKAILDREQLASTGFGEGLAMPHVRLPAARDFHTVLARTKTGIEYSAIDGNPVHLLLLVVGPESEKDGYQKLMARGAKFLKAAGPGLLDAPDLQTATLAALQEL